MAIKTITPYLFFNGTAEKAIALYERVLGARTEGLQKYGDVPAVAETCAAEDRARVMNAVLHIGGSQVMVGDSPPSMPCAVGSNMELCLDFDDAEDMARKFEALSASGKVHMAIHDTFWGAKLGSLVDEHGVGWMFHYDMKAK